MSELERYPGRTQLGADLATACSPPVPVPPTPEHPSSVFHRMLGGGWGLRGGRAGRLNKQTKQSLHMSLMHKLSLEVEGSQALDEISTRCQNFIMKFQQGTKTACEIS